MRLVSPLLKHAVYPALHRIGWLDHTMPPGGYAVVNYHGVVPSDHSVAEVSLDGNLVRPEMFRRQLQFLKAHYDVVGPEDFRAWVEQGKQLPPRAVLVTCDDGLLNTLTEMLPVLQSEGVSLPFFHDRSFVQRPTRHALVRGALPLDARQTARRTRVAASWRRSHRTFREFSSPVVEYGEKSLAIGRKGPRGLDGPRAQSLRWDTGSSF